MLLHLAGQDESVMNDNLKSQELPVCIPLLRIQKQLHIPGTNLY